MRYRYSCNSAGFTFTSFDLTVRIVTVFAAVSIGKQVMTARDASRDPSHAMVTLDPKISGIVPLGSGHIKTGLPVLNRAALRVFAPRLRSMSGCATAMISASLP